MQQRLLDLIILGFTVILISSESYALIDPIAEDSEKNLKSRTVVPLQLPPKTKSLKKIEVQKANWVEHTVKSGENLSIIFTEMGLSGTDLHEILADNPHAKKLKTLHPGQTLRFSLANDGSLKKLIIKINRIKDFVVWRTESGYKTEKQEKELDRQVTYAYGVIENSLYLAAKKAGLSDKLTMQLSDIFAWDIDFALNLRAGDHFTIMYEKLLLNGEQIDTGEILAAEFANRGTTYQAVLYTDVNNESSHYTADGNSLRKAFLKTPVEFARISSRFNLRRRHPVLNRIRAHKGVDYAAPTGTPVRATGNGKIVFRGRKGGYGRTVVVKHGEKYSTLYAHLSRYSRNSKTRSQVKQGQIIGYVGRSGLATGPHLHYEFRVNGVHKNPLTVKYPHSKPIQKKFLAHFKKNTQRLLSQLEKVRTILLAQSQ